jgi:NADH-quinone oxidoreductase subunit N
VGTVLANQDGISPALVLALGLVLGGFTVKLGAAPLQWWVPDVFEAVPLPVVGFIASSGLAATFAVFLRFMEWSFAPRKVAVPAVLALVAAVSMTFGNLAALFEDRLRRLLAYSTAAQAGYALAGLAAFKQEGGISAVLIFILALALANLAALTAVVGYQRAMESDRLADLAGMSRHAPGLALVLGLAVASLIGAPPLAGFFGKLLVTQSVIQAGFTWLAILVLVNSLVAAIYYLRVLKAVFIDPAGFELDPVHYGGSLRTAMTVSAAGLMASTVFLGPLYTAAGHATRALLH